MNELLTANEAADRLRISRRLLYQLLAEGKLPGVKVGREWRVSRAALDEAVRTGLKEAVR
jgi:excisionase family DNA binding protein